MDLGPMIPQLCTDALLEESIALAQELGVVIHTHLAESRVETSTSFARFGRSLVEHLSAIGLLSPRTLLAHAVWMSDQDIDVIASTGALVAHAPGSNLRLGCGVARVADMLRAGITVGVGTDGSASSDNQNMFEAMRLAAIVSRIRSYDEEDWLSAETVLRLATENTAAVLGSSELLGALRPGYKADITGVDSASVYLRPRNHLAAQLVLAESGSGVKLVIVDGNQVFRDGRILRVDEKAILNGADEAARAIRSRNEGEWELVRQMAPYVSRRSMWVTESMPWTNHQSKPVLSMIDA
jgi:5-methylthioadenosine/S-adenosylhomocysteine deaminase